jgi:hypothetical protein
MSELAAMAEEQGALNPAADLRSGLENGDSQEQGPRMTPENTASAVAQAGELTP